MQVINKGLNKQKRPRPAEENKLGQIRTRAFWKFHSVTETPQLHKTSMFAAGVNGSTSGPRPCTLQVKLGEKLLKLGTD